MMNREEIKDVVKETALKYGVPYCLFLAQLIHESNLNPLAKGDYDEHGNPESFGLGQINLPTHTDFDVARAFHGLGGEPDVAYQCQYCARLLLAHYEDEKNSGPPGREWWRALRDYNGSGWGAEKYATGILNTAAYLEERGWCAS